MKKILFPILALILCACSPQVTVTFTPQTSEVSETSEVLIPTQTAEPYAQEFTNLQTQISQSDTYTLTPLAIEMKNEDGTITKVPDIKPNTKDGSFTITYEGQEFIVAFETIEENKLTFTGEEDRKWVWNGNNLLHSYFEEELAQMTAEQKLEAAPQTIGDLERSNLSTVPDRDYLVLYRDDEGNAIKVFNLQTGKELSLPEAGIIEFIMKDGQRLEMAYFEEIQEAIDYLYLERGAHDSTRERMQHKDAIKKIQNLLGINGSNVPDELGREFISGYEVLFDANDRSNIAFGTYVLKFDNGTLIDAYTKNSMTELVYINQDADKIANLIGGGIVTATTP